MASIPINIQLLFAAGASLVLAKPAVEGIQNIVNDVREASEANNLVNSTKDSFKPTENDGFTPADGHKGEDYVKNPNGPGRGWRDKDGKVWVPQKRDKAHGGFHWDKQDPKTGNHENVYPDGHVRDGSKKD